MNCPLCERDTDYAITGICTSCEARLSQQLGEIVAYANACASMIEPQRSGDNGHSPAYGSRPPVNITALDYSDLLGFVDTVRLPDGSVRSSDRNGLAMLHEWERLVREERHLTPPALIPYAGNQLAEIRGVCTFLANHLPWAAQQSWADELAREVHAVHRAGMIALRAVPPRRGRIACPGDDPATGDICSATIWLPDDLHDYVKQAGQAAPAKTLFCAACGTAWTFDRLLRVAVSLDPKAVVKGFGKDFIEQHLGVSRRHVNRLLAGTGTEG